MLSPCALPPACAARASAAGAVPRLGPSRCSARPASHSAEHGPRELLLLPDGFKERVEASFEARTSYDANNTFHARLAEALLRRTPLCAGHHVLDVACGTGMVALPAARAVGPGGRVLGLDLSAGMLAQAARKAQAGGAPPGVLELLKADVDDAVFPDASFDVITCSAAMPFLPDIPRALARWRRWLRPGGGALAFNAFRAPTNPEYGILLELLLSRHSIRLEDPCARLGSEELCRQALLATGFCEVQVWADEQQDRVERTAGQFVEGVWRQALTSAFAPLEMLLPQEALRRLHDEYVAAATESAAARVVDGAVVNSTVTYVVLGRRRAEV